jgi:hypothetical protein
MNKYQKIGLIAFALGIFNLASNVHAIRVPASEVPNTCAWLTNPDCHNTLFYERVDADPVFTNPGTPSTVLGGSIVCDNCASKGTQNCSHQLSASFTQTIVKMITITIQVAPEGIGGKFDRAFGTQDGTTVTFTVSCGGAVPPKSYITYTAYQNTIIGKTASVTSTYTCFARSSGPPPCANNTGSQPGGSVESTATGNLGSQNGGCKSIDGTCQE